MGRKLLRKYRGERTIKNAQEAAKNDLHDQEIGKGRVRMDPGEQRVGEAEIRKERGNEDGLASDTIRQRSDQRHQRGQAGKADRLSDKASLSGRCSCVVANVGM